MRQLYLNSTLSLMSFRCKQVKEGKRSEPLMTPQRVRELCLVSGSSKQELVVAIQEDCGCGRQSSYRFLWQALASKTIKENETHVFFRN